MTDRSLLLVGCGKMGRALLTRWRELHPGGIDTYWVIEPNGKPIPGMKAFWVADLKFLPRTVKPNVIVFAVKPQQMGAILHHYRTRFGMRPLYISIAAGKTLSFLTSHLDRGARIVRVMPNLPAMIGEGMSVLCSPKASKLSTDIATALMSAVGKTAWVKEEAQMDVVTALSGSGPAYVFLFIESLVEAAVAQGLPKDIAHQLALQTVTGSVALANLSTEPLETLRDKVVSPGGTTEAALEILMDNGQFAALVAQAVKRAADRSRELSL